MDVASFLSSPVIPTATAALGAAVFLFSFIKIRMLDYRYSTLCLFGLWLLTESACYLASTAIFAGKPFDDIWFADTAIFYGYLYSASAVVFMVYAIARRHLFPNSIVLIFLVITLISVPYWAFNFALQVDADTWGSRFYHEYSAILDLAYFATIVGLEAWLAWLGIKCAISDTATDSDGGICL